MSTVVKVLLSKARTIFVSVDLYVIPQAAEAEVVVPVRCSRVVLAIDDVTTTVCAQFSSFCQKYLRSFSRVIPQGGRGRGDDDKIRVLGSRVVLPIGDVHEIPE